MTEVPVYINKDQLEARFGGTVPDKMDNYFPPDMAQEGETMLSMAEYKSLLN